MTEQKDPNTQPDFLKTELKFPSTENPTGSTTLEPAAPVSTEAAPASVTIEAPTDVSAPIADLGAARTMDTSTGFPTQVMSVAELAAVPPIPVVVEPGTTVTTTITTESQPTLANTPVSTAEQVAQSTPDLMAPNVLPATPPSPDLREGIWATPPEAVIASIERMAASEPGFVEAVKAAQAKVDTDPALYGQLGTQSGPLEGITFADAVVRSMNNDTREPSWIKVAGQTVKVDAAGRKATIWRTYTDEQMAANAPGFDWDAIKKLVREATIVATKSDQTATRLEVIDAPKAS